MLLEESSPAKGLHLIFLICLLLRILAYSYKFLILSQWKNRIFKHLHYKYDGSCKVCLFRNLDTILLKMNISNILYIEILYFHL